MNKLPEKLSLLRKSSGLPQSEIAAKLMVPVSEYMNWENGNSIPNIAQLKNISEMFGVDISALLDNTMTFVAPKMNTMDQSVQIPFMENGGLNATQDLSAVSGDTVVVPNTSAVEDGATKVMNTDTFAATQIAEIDDLEDDEEQYDDEYDDEEDEEEVKPKKTKAKAKKSSDGPSKTTKIIVSVICGVALIAIAVGAFFLLRDTLSSVEVSDTNRLALGTKYSVYVSSSSSLQIKGEDYDASTLKGSVQVSVYDEMAAGLMSDGTVVCTDDSIDVSEWEDVTMVAAGTDHVVGLLSDGTVVCEGNDDACNVDSWEEVASVYAGDGITVALTEEGSFLSSGGVSIPTVTGVTDVAVSDGVVYYITKSGDVATIVLSGGTAQSSTSLVGAVSIAAGETFVAGLNEDGTVTVSSTDTETFADVENWEDVAYIAGRDNTLIAITEDGLMYGAGDNTYGQYENTADAADATASAEATATATAGISQLSSVTNLSASADSENLTITWSSVENAGSYQVTLSGGIGTLAETQSTSASISTSKLTIGTTYTISVVAIPEDTDLYEESAAATTSFTYSGTQLSAPTGLSVTTDSSSGYIMITWNAVSNASLYTVLIDGKAVIPSTSNQFYQIPASSLTSGTTHTIGVYASGSSSKYTDSSVTTIDYTYIYPESYTVTINYNVSDGSSVSSRTVTLDAYSTFNHSDYIPDGYSLVGSDVTVTVDGNKEITIYITQNG